jgi:transposase
VPDAPTQAMRALLRTRKQLVREQASHVQRLQKTLEDANLKLASVLTDVMGLSGRAILEALVAGERDPDRLLALVPPRVKAEPARLRAALTGRLTDRHRFLLRLHLGQYDALRGALAEIDAEVERDLDPFRDAVRLLRTVPGIGDLAAQVIVSEIGTDMGRFPTAGHLVSWAGLCPRNDESAGERRSTRLRQGAPWLKTALVQCAWAASRKKDGYLRAQFQRAAAPTPRPQEGDLRRRRLHARRHLAHAPPRHLLPGPRARPLPQALARAAGRASRPPDRQAWLHLHPHAPGGAGFCLVRHQHD